MLLFQQIEDLAYKHTDARRTIGEFLLAKKSRVREYNMQQIAEETFSSKSSLVRFAKALGFSGWKEFMEQFLSDSYYEESHYTDIDPADRPDEPGPQPVCGGAVPPQNGDHRQECADYEK